MEIGINSICKGLIKDKIPSPTTLSSNKGSALWNPTTIRRILKNEVYVGNTIGHKVKKINYKLKKQIMLNKDEWIKVENTHIPIISKEDFKKVQNILNKRSYTPQGGKPHLLTGIIYCAKCGGKCTYIKGYKSNSYVICRNKKIYGNTICNLKSIKEEVLNNIVVSSIKDIISKYANKEYILNNLNNKVNNSFENSLVKEKESLKLKLNESNNIKFNLYKDKLNSVISEKDYILFISSVNKDIQNYENRIANIIERLANITDEVKNKNNITGVIDDLFNANSLARNDILQLIDRIEISAKQEYSKIKIYFKFLAPS